MTLREERNRKNLRRRTAAQRARARRGVLLLIVLSILVMFMLVGTAFVLTGTRFGTGARVDAKANAAVPQQADLLDRALRQVLRDTNDRNSAIRYHSLLRDAYGTDGFVAKVFTGDTPVDADQLELGFLPNSLAAPYVSRFADDTLSDGGPTRGQLIDIYVRDDLGLAAGAMAAVEQTRALTPDYVVGLEPSEDGLPVNHTLSRTNGYYNGCLLTMLTGPAKGQSTRILSYQYDPSSNLSALRVMAFPRAGGGLLRLPTGVPVANGAPHDLIDASSGALVGHAFMVNGRPFNGSGVGLNLLSGPADARLTAVELMGALNSPYGFAEVALAPHSRYFNPLNNAAQAIVGVNANGGTYPLVAANQTGSLYEHFVGPGGADESYDAPDFQNMFLASNPQRPRARGRVIRTQGLSPIEADEYLAEPGQSAPWRLDLTDVPIPSFHRPALVNYWLNRLYSAPWLTMAIPNRDDRVKAILQPYGPDHIAGTGDDRVPDPVIAAQIVAFKRKYTLRPLIEDHPGFSGSNSFSTYGSADYDLDRQRFARLGPQRSFRITFPSFEVAGPWDVDNNGDGVPDSIWVDLGMPVQRTEDGKHYKPLFAIMVQDLDGRLNLNAHGSTDQMATNLLDNATDQGSGRRLARSPSGGLGGNLAGDYDPGKTANVLSADLLPHGSGWGPSDVSLRSVLSPELPRSYSARVGNYNYDDLARLFAGRPGLNTGGSSAATSSPVVWGRYGSQAGVSLNNALAVAPGKPYYVAAPTAAAALATIDTLAALEKHDYPELSPADPSAVRSGFMSVPDLRSKFSVGLDFSGQPVAESQYEVYLNKPSLLKTDSPYELELMDHARRDSVSDLADVTAAYGGVGTINDDAPFSPGELERILRSFDADAARLPERLWNLVDAFDPQKLAVQNYQLTAANPDDTSRVQPTPSDLLQAQIEAATNSRAVTTESFDIPSTNEDWTARLAVGADGLPGVPNVDDNNDGVTDGPGEAGLGTFNPNNQEGSSDDYAVVMGEPVPQNARLLDYLRYRIVLELRTKNLTVNETIVNQIIHGADLPSNAVRNGLYSFGGLLAPEVLSGLKMDLNRPFGDGQDNSFGRQVGVNGVVDEPQEAGEPWVDTNGNGVYDSGEPYLEQNGLAGFQGSVDRMPNQAFVDAYPFDYTFGADANGRGKFVDQNGDGVFDAGDYVIHDDGDMARQLYARHLYCLGMLVMDENYLAPYDANDPQVVDYLDPDAEPDPAFDKPGSPAWQIAQGLAGDPDLDGTPAASPAHKLEAVRIARKKLTCRKLAQWAINCADMRDPDAICTPFEYDENPWDGWNVVGSSGRTVYPIDGDVGTDENLGVYNVITDTGWRRVDNAPAINPAQQTRGVVWGAERPELLISETLAFHDRRAEDLSFTDKSIDTQATDANGDRRSDTNYKIGEALPPGDDTAREDSTMDQRLRPEGGAYVELYNPWSQDGLLPAELSKTVTFPNPQTGIDLGKLSAVGVPGVDANGDPAVKHSPVWRLIAIEDHPRLRNDDPMDDPEGGYATRLPKQYEEYTEFTNPKMLALARRRLNAQGGFNPAADPEQSRATIPDPDFPTFNQDLQPKVVRNATQFPHTTSTGEILIPETTSRVQINVPRQHVERAFYFTSGNDGIHGPNNPTNPTNPANPDVRIPLNRIKIPESMLPAMWRSYLRGGGSNSNFGNAPRRSATETLLWPDGMAIVTEQANGQNINYLEIFNHHFVPRFSELFNADVPDDNERTRDITLAPVLPGRYAVVGTAGYSYVEGRRTGVKRNPGRFITPLGRRVSAVGPDQEDPLPVVGDETGSGFGAAPAGNGQGTRRIELIPSPNPEAHQVLVADNAGNESTIVDFNNDGTHDRNITSAFVNGSDPKSIRQDVNDAIANGFRQGLARTSAGRLIQPAVAVPVKGMSLSAPLDNYLLRWMELEPGFGGNQPGRDWEPKGAGGEGEYVDREDRDEEAPFDEPFDLPRELVENHTTPNYRSVHLQRLANPLLPWNPPPGQEFHVADVPVNPYLTIDSSSVDLTAFNGTDPKEQSIGIQGDRRVATTTNPSQLHEYDAPLPSGDRQTVMTLASQQRGFHAVELQQGQQPPARLLFQRELPNLLPELQSTRLTGANSIHTAGGTKSQFERDLRITPQLSPRQHVIDYPIRHSLGFMNVPLGSNSTFVDFYTQTDGEEYHLIDANGDGVPGDIVGAPKVDRSPGDVAGPLNDDTFPWMHWGNRPYASALELLQVPASSGGRLTADFSIFNERQAAQFNPYNGARNEDWNQPDPINAIRLRRSNEIDQFGHLPNLFSSDLDPAHVTVTNNQHYAIGAANLHRLTSYLRVPSRFVATQTTLNPQIFNPLGADLNTSVDDVRSPTDPRAGKLAPFNRVDQYREPGRVNLNTVTGVRPDPLSPLVTWSLTYDGLMHRYRDGNVTDTGGTLLQIGHRGPAWRDVVLSRRGYVDTAVVSPRDDTSEMSLNPLVPTFFGNPFREPDEALMVPLSSMIRPGAEASLLRSHPFSPSDGGWGQAGADDNNDGVRDDAGEAGLSGDTALFQADGTAAPYVDPNENQEETAEVVRVPLFSAGTTETALNSNRNAALRYMPMTRMSSMATTRSGVFAIWVTVGFFEVTPAPAWTDAGVPERFNNSRELYDRVYPDGYQLGKELGSDTGDTRRHRGFWIVDRTLPVAFRPGEDVNLEKMILLRREIE